jgi:hypothetical protein
MRAGIGLILAVAAAAAGCKSRGFYEESAKDLSDKNMKAGTTLDLGQGLKVKVAKFDVDFKSAKPKVVMALVNEGPPQDFLSFDLEVGYAAPPGSIAPYVPDFIPLDFTDWKAGETKDRTYPLPEGQKAMPLFARILTTTGADVRMTADRETSDMGLREGTRLLSGKVEVVKLDADLTPSGDKKPRLAFTLENVDEKGAEVGNFRYMVQFYDRDGKYIDLGRRFASFKPAGKPLGKKGDRVTVEVAGMDNITVSLAGAKPVLRVIQ